jgi:hypothetical protein
VDFVTSFSDENFRVVTARNMVTSTSANRLFFFNAFSWQVWIGIAALLLVHVFVTAMDANFAPLRGNVLPPGEQSRFEKARHFLLKSSVLFRLRHALFNSMFHIVGQTVEVDTHKSGTKEKIMNLLALAIGVFLVSIFQASVTYQVLLGVPQTKFKSVNDFKDCTVPPDRVCLIRRGASRDFWDQAIAPSEYVGHHSALPTKPDHSPHWLRIRGSAYLAHHCSLSYVLLLNRSPTL